MVTDRIPQKAKLRVEYERSDQLRHLELPADYRFRTPATAIEVVLDAEQSSQVRKTCSEFVAVAADFYGVARPQIRVLAARPLKVREGRRRNRAIRRLPL